MYLSDFLLILVFLAFILYKVYKKQLAKKKEKEKESADSKERALTAIENADASAPLREYCNRGIYRVDIIKFDSDIPYESMQERIDSKLESLEASGAPRPKDIKAVMNTNTIIVALIWY